MSEAGGARHTRTNSVRQRPVPRIALTPSEAAEAIGCSPEFFREHVDHELRWIRRGRKRFVPLVELERWAEANAETTL
jgi:excisionase family DNA binding protein